MDYNRCWYQPRNEYKKDISLINMLLENDKNAYIQQSGFKRYAALAELRLSNQGLSIY